MSVASTGNWQVIGGPLGLGRDYPLTSLLPEFKITDIIIRRLFFFFFCGLGNFGLQLSEFCLPLGRGYLEVPGKQL